MTAAAVGPLIRRLMDSQGITSKAMAARLGVNVQSLTEWRRGHKLPSVKNAEKLADALAAPSILSLVTRARTLTCDVCKRPFVQTNSGGRKRRYCSMRCQATGTSEMRKGENKVLWGKVHTRWQNRYRRAQDAIDRMCGECSDWENVCRIASCPLRSVSPLPLVVEDAA